MLTAECPNCGAAITFRHSASVLAVCSACHGAIQRTDDALLKIGELSALSRDLSPIQIGVTGQTAKGAFSVIGVLRKGREGLRWNEWRIAYDNGDLGWLSEGNGQLILFDDSPCALEGLRDVEVGDDFTLETDGEKSQYKVTEKAEATLLAAEGELNILAEQGQPLSYMDAREVGGVGFATIDREGGDLTAWRGRVVDLTRLQLAGLRPFAGWSDSVLLSFEGPQITSVRSFECPQCGASLSLKAPGEAVAVGCQYCGSELRVDEGASGMALQLYRKARKHVDRFQIPIGSIIHFRGQRWEAIGAICRSVTEDGEEYPWEEYLWRNPYVGYRWMIVSDGHFSWGSACTELPYREGLSVGYSDLTWRNKHFQPYAKGRATVKSVVGEFTWQIAKGDQAMTYDFISPPFMLSFESIRNSTAAGGDEDNWTWVEYVERPEIVTAFGGVVPPGIDTSGPDGVAPHQPNPWRIKATVNKALATIGVLFAVWVAIYVLLFQSKQPEHVKDVLFQYDAFIEDQATYSKVYGAAEGKDPVFEIKSSEPWSALELKYSSTPGESWYVAHVALINLDTGKAYLFPSGRNEKGVYTNPDPGKYALRVEHAFNKVRIHKHNKLLEADAKTKPTYTTAVKISKNPKNEAAFGIWAIFSLFLILGPMAFFGYRANFEVRRWRDSNV